MRLFKSLKEPLFSRKVSKIVVDIIISLLYGYTSVWTLAYFLYQFGMSPGLDFFALTGGIEDHTLFPPKYFMFFLLLSLIYFYLLHKPRILTKVVFVIGTIPLILYFLLLYLFSGWNG